MTCALAACTLAILTPAVGGEPACLPCVDLTGRWTGCWVSDKNGHHGPLRAHVTRISDSCYRFRFSGRFWKVFPFVYSVTLRVVEVRADGVVLSGGLFLGPLLGSFQCDAFATATQFDAVFRSKKDWGRFSLSRSSCLPVVAVPVP